MSNYWCWTLNTLGGVDLNPAGAEYTTELDVGQTRTQTAAREVQAARRSGRGPVYTGTTIGERTIIVTHKIAGTGSTHEDNLRQLKQEHYSTTFGARTLVYTDNDSIAKRTTIAAARILPHDSTEERVVKAEWVLIDPVDYTNDDDAIAPATKSASPATYAVAAGGNEYTEVATITLDPSAAKSAANGQRYMVPITPINRVPRPLRRWPVDITERIGTTGWDHAAEVTATRSASDGDDVEVYVNAKRVDRWTWASGAGTWNASATRLWVNLDMPPARYWTYRAAATLGAADVTATVAYADGEMVNMPAVPFYATFVTSNGATAETVRVTAADEDTGTLTIVRAQRGTSATTWADASKLYWCPVLIDLVYGWTSAPSPSYINDRNKPMFLATVPSTLSSNGKFVWQSFMETDIAGQIRTRVPRTAAWYPRLYAEKFGREDMFWGIVPWTGGLGSDATTATSMSIGIREKHPVINHPYADCWEFVSPIGITAIDYTETTATIDFDEREARLACTAVGADGTTEDLRYDHSDAATARTGTPTSNAYAVRFRFDPFDPVRDSQDASILAANPTDDVGYASNDGFLVDNVELTFDSAEKVLVAWGSRVDAYQFGRPGAPATLANSDGDTLELDGLPIATSDVLTLNLDTQSVTVSDGTGRNHCVFGTWWRIAPGTNNLTYTETGIGSIDIAIPSLNAAWV